MKLDRKSALARAQQSPVGRLATTRPEGSPHIVPVTFAIEDDVVHTMVDKKPKTTTDLQRLRNIAANPDVSLLVDHYESDWTKLWWVRVDGTATLSESEEDLVVARMSLRSKYPQYQDQPPDGPAIRIEIDGVTWWESAR